MIRADASLMRKLERERDAARVSAGEETAHMVLEEIEALRRAHGEGVLYSVSVMAAAFGVPASALLDRTNPPGGGFQGHLPKAPLLAANGRFLLCGTWFQACAVNKSTHYYTTWGATEDAIRALHLAHETDRLVRPRRSGQARIDKWQLGTHAQKAE